MLRTFCAYFKLVFQLISFVKCSYIDIYLVIVVLFVFLRYHYYGIGIRETSQYYHSVYTGKGLTRYILYITCIVFHEHINSSALSTFEQRRIKFHLYILKLSLFIEVQSYIIVGPYCYMSVFSYKLI